MRTGISLTFMQKNMQLCVTNGFGRQIPYFSTVSPSKPPFREGQGFILVYSITARSSFERLETFQQSLVNIKHQKPIFILIANKCDMSHERQVSTQEGFALAQTFGCKFLETSARTAYNVELLFTKLVQDLRPSKPIQPGIKQRLGDKPRKGYKKGKNARCIMM